MNKKKLSNHLLSTPFYLWIGAFIVIPLFMIFYYGFTDKTGAFTLENITAMVEPWHFKALMVSVVLSVISTIICFLLAYPLAYILSQMKVNSHQYVVFMFILPMWMNFLLRTLAWQTLIEKTGVINGFLAALGLPALRIINTNYAIVLGMVYNYLPFMILPLYNTLAKIDPSVVNAARDLGANSFITFKRIIFPLSIPGIISGITMVFVPALTSFAVSEILGGGKVLLIGNVIEESFMQGSLWNQGSGLSFVLMIFVFVSMAITNIFDKEGEGTAVW